jgi:hypothetical protein
MAMNDTEEDTLLAFGTADISAFDCDIYVNSNHECAMAGNGNPLIEVGDAGVPGMIYVVGDSCSTNENVEWNCNLDTEALAAGATCPETNLSYAEQQVDPFEYTQLDSSMDTLKDLACGSQYAPDSAGLDFSNGLALWEAYGYASEADATVNNQSGLGEFKVESYVTDDFCPDSDGLGTPDLYQNATCDGPIVPVLDGDGNPIIAGGKVLTDANGWTWTGDSFEFHMVPGAYCGGINVRGNGTLVLGDGDYILKGQAVAGANGGKDEFNLRANTAIEGLNVAFYLADADIAINWGGSAQTDLIGRQETDDPMNGFLFYGDTSNEGPHLFRGTPAGGYQGIMYFPEGDVEFKGTADSDLEQADGTDLCSVLIADTIYFNGTTAFHASADSCGGDFEIPPVGAQLVLRLVN